MIYSWLEALNLLKKPHLYSSEKNRLAELADACIQGDRMIWEDFVDAALELLDSLAMTPEDRQASVLRAAFNDDGQSMAIITAIKVSVYQLLVYRGC
jgi:hypothetical protein